MKKILLLLGILISFIAEGQPLIQSTYGVYDGQKNGLIGDSSTNNTSRLQYIIDNAPASSTIILGPGKFIKNGTIYINKPITIKGSNTQTGNDNSFIYPINCGIFETSTTDSGFVVNSIGVTFQDIVIINSNSSTPSSTNRGIYWQTAQSSHMYNVPIMNFYVPCEIKNGGSWVFRDCRFQNGISYNLIVADSAAHDNGDQTCDNCFFTSTISRSVGVTHIRWNSGGGLRLIAPKFNSSSGNYALDCIDMRGFLGTVDFFCTGGFSAENFTGNFINLTTPSVGIKNFVVGQGEIAPQGSKPFIYIDGAGSSPQIQNGSIDGLVMVGTGSDTGIYINNAIDINIGLANQFSGFGAGMQVVYGSGVAYNSNIRTAFPTAIIPVTPSSLKINFDVQQGNVFLTTLTGNDTINIIGGTFGTTVLMSLTQDGTGGRVPVLPSGGNNFIGGNIQTIGVNTTAGTQSYIYGFINTARQLTVTQIWYIGANSGTVTSVATGIGLTGGTITTTGTLKVDTTYIPRWNDTTGAGTNTLVTLTYLNAHSSSGGGTPGGNSQDIQVKSGTSFFGSDNFTWDTTNNIAQIQKTIAATPTDGLRLYSSGTAALNAQQYSPSLHFKGFGWSTTNTASRATDWIIYADPVQGAANPTADLVFANAVNGGGFATVLQLNTNYTLVGAGSQINSGILNVNGITNLNGNVWLASASATSGARVLTSGGNIFFDMMASAGGLNIRTNTNGLNSAHFDGANNGSLTLGTLTAQAKGQLEVFTTGTQQAWMYDATHYTTGTTGSTGNFTLVPSGGKASITGIIANSGMLTSVGTVTVLTHQTDSTITQISIPNLMATTFSSGQTTLVSGTKAISITGVTTSSKAFITLVTPSGVSLTVHYQAVCTSGTVTLQADIAAGTINTSDISVVNYFVIF